MAFPSRAPSSPGDFYLNVDAATGDEYPMYTNVKNSLARTSGTMKGASFNVEPGDYDALNCTGMEACVYGGSSVSSTGSIRGIYVEAQGFDGGIADLWGAYIYIDNNADASGASAVLRLEDNSGTASYSDAYIYFACKNGKGPNSCFFFNANFAGGNKAGTISGQNGYLTVDWAGSTRYIALYDTQA